MFARLAFLAGLVALAIAVFARPSAGAGRELVYTVHRGDTLWSIAANVSGNASPSTIIPRTTCHGCPCQVAREPMLPAANSIPSASGHFEPYRRPSTPASGPETKPATAPGSRNRPAPVALASKP